MPRRGRRNSPFSLFSFQDIITSVTAILILIVLILSLELVTRKSRDAAASPAMTRASLEESITDLEKLAARLEQKAAMPSAAARRRAVAEIDRDIRITLDQIEAAKGDLETAERINDAAQSEARVAATRLEAARSDAAEAERRATEAEDIAGEAARVAAANERDRQHLEAERERRRDKPSPGTELVFNAPPDDGRQPWLLEVSVDGCAALALGTGMVQALGPETGPGSPFSVWADSLRTAEHYVLLLVRPSGTDRFDAVRSALRDRNITIGIDFIGEEQAVHDGIAARPGRAAGNATGTTP